MAVTIGNTTTLEVFGNISGGTINVPSGLSDGDGLILCIMSAHESDVTYANIDDELVDTDPVIRPLLEKFVCVRIVGTNVDQ